MIFSSQCGNHRVTTQGYSGLTLPYLLYGIPCLNTPPILVTLCSFNILVLKYLFFLPTLQQGRTELGQMWSTLYLLETNNSEHTQLKNTRYFLLDDQDTHRSTFFPECQHTANCIIFGK